jgi:hypothetical protein
MIKNSSIGKMPTLTGLTVEEFGGIAARIAGLLLSLRPSPNGYEISSDVAQDDRAILIGSDRLAFLDNFIVRENIFIPAVPMKSPTLNPVENF